MTSAEFTEAMAFEQLEPDPQETAVRLLADLSALFHNVYKHQTTAPYTAEDFLPGGNRQQRLAAGSRLLAEYGAHRLKKSERDN